MAPPDLPAEPVHARDELTMPDSAPAPRRRTAREPPPRTAAPARGKVRRRDQRRMTRMLLAGAAAQMDEERVEEEQEYAYQEEVGAGQYDGDEAHDQAGVDVGGEAAYNDLGSQIPFPSRSPTGLISFSPEPARQFPSPNHAGTSSGPQSFHEQHGGPSCPTATTTQPEHGTWVPTYSSPPVVGYPVFNPARIGHEWATPPSYDAPTSYHSHVSTPQHFSAPVPTVTQPVHDQDPSTAAEPAPAPPPRRRQRTVRPPACGTGGHLHGRGTQ
ncbi:hypothetical protein PIB30_041898 [Stylosanthes scabra]|uniref:Uncharacterized protein n=1 Tax=Stylosanthes scabra TaxID=79078 RepID=A0ABU6ZDV0_9FABA|nr:hypothetical protein [Stylosanthes scabra]